MVEAIRAAKQTAKANPGEKIRMLGYLVHNTHVTDELQANGIELVDSDNRFEGLDQIEGGTVIFTAHGVSQTAALVRCTGRLTAPVPPRDLCGAS